MAPPERSAPFPLADDERLTRDRLRHHVDVLAGLIGPRHLGKPTTLEAAAAHIDRSLTESGLAVQRHPYPVGDQAAVNLTADLTGTRKPDHLVLLGAHYDTVPTTPGADDNASAVAAMLEVARLLKETPQPRTIRFVAFANEEPPYFHTAAMGSAVYARQLREQNANVDGLICLEMIGYYDPAPGSQEYPVHLPAPLQRILPDRGDFLGAVGNLHSLNLLRRFRAGFKRGRRFPLIATPLPEGVHGARFSDNASFWDQGYPALMVTDTSFFRNPHYHRASDTPETLDYNRLARVTHCLAHAVEAVAA